MRSNLLWLLVVVVMLWVAVGIVSLIVTPPVVDAQTVDLQREVFVGTEAARVVSVPYYHLPPLPEPDFAWGMYFDFNRIPEDLRTDEYVRLCMCQMAAAGLNTVTIYGDAETAARHLQIAVDEGLVATQPVMLLGCGPQGVPQDAPVELVGYGPDEPRVEDAAQVAASVAAWHEVGLRCATAIKPDALAGGLALDVWIVNARGLDERAVREGHELWMYECRFRGTNRALHRYWTGLYAYAMHRRFDVQAQWTWGYLHDDDSRFREGREGTWRWEGSGRYEHALPGPNGPIGTVGLDGMTEGIRDFAILKALEEAGGGKGWLDALVARVEPHFWQGVTPACTSPLEYANMWDVHDAAVPLIDVEAEVATATRLLLAERAGY